MHSESSAITYSVSASAHNAISVGTGPTASASAVCSARPSIVSSWVCKAAAVLTFLAVIVAGATIQAGKFLVVDNPKPSDVIVVLSGDDGSRLPKAIELWKRGLAGEVIVDGGDRQRWLGRTEADRIAAQLALLGPAAGRVHVCPVAAESTLGEAQDFFDCIRDVPVTRILIVTSAYHSRRALSTFRYALPRYQWSVAAADKTETFGTSWWRNREWAATTLHEWEKLAWWEAVEKWTVRK